MNEHDEPLQSAAPGLLENIVYALSSDTAEEITFAVVLAVAVWLAASWASRK